MFTHFRSIISFILIVAFTGSSLSVPQAQAGEMVALRLPAPGVMVHLSPEFTPAHLQGMTIHPDNALQFDFLIGPGDGHLDGLQKKIEYTKLVKYFLASLTIPDQDQWVNLSPYEHNRIIQDDFGKTEMGRDLLAQDYLLKQITSSLMYPETGLGKEFWDRVYERAWREFGTSQIPVNTFNKVWIIPDEAAVYESGNTVYILRNHLKVMLEQDYLALEKNNGKNLSFPNASVGNPNMGKTGPSTKTFEGDKAGSLSSQIIRQIILPELENEVNEGKNFAMLRQIYSGMILATWYKHALKESLLGKVYANKARVRGVDQADPRANERIYERYLQAFKKGVFNYIKEDQDKYTQQMVPRKYFAGGVQGYVQGVTRGFSDGAMAVFTEATGIPKNAAEKIDLAGISGRVDRASVVLDADQDVPMSTAKMAEPYADRLKFLNPDYISPHKINGIHYSTETDSVRVAGLDEVLEAYNAKFDGTDIHAVLLGAGLRKDGRIESSPQFVEVVAALGSVASRKLDLTVIDRNPQVLKVITRKNQFYITDKQIPKSFWGFLYSRREAGGKRIFDFHRPSNADVKVFLGRFQDLNFGENKTDLIIALNSLLYINSSLNHQIVLQSWMRIVNALKPSGKLIVDRDSMFIFIPSIDKKRQFATEKDVASLEPEILSFEQDVYERFGISIRLRFYKDIVEIEKLPKGTEPSAAGSRMAIPESEEDRAQASVDRVKISWLQPLRQSLGPLTVLGLSDDWIKKQEMADASMAARNANGQTATEYQLSRISIGAVSLPVKYPKYFDGQKIPIDSLNTLLKQTIKGLQAQAVNFNLDRIKGIIIVHGPGEVVRDPGVIEIPIDLVLPLTQDNKESQIQARIQREIVKLLIYEEQEETKSLSPEALDQKILEYMANLPPALPEVPYYTKAPPVNYRIIVPVFNEEDQLEKILERIKGLGYLDKVTFVNDASTDRSREILDHWKATDGIEVMHLEKNQKKEGAIREAVEMLAREGRLPEKLVLMDADSFITTDKKHTFDEMIAQASEYMDQKDITGLAFRYDIYLPEHPTLLQRAQYADFAGFRFINRIAPKQNQLWVINGRGGIFRSDVLRDILKDLKPDFETGDLMITTKIMEKGYKVGYFDKVRVVTMDVNTIADYFKQRLRWERGTVKVLFSERNFYAGEIKRLSKIGFLALFNLGIRIGLPVGVMKGILFDTRTHFATNIAVQMAFWATVSTALAISDPGIRKEGFRFKVMRWSIINAFLYTGVTIPARVVGSLQAVKYILTNRGNYINQERFNGAKLSFKKVAIIAALTVAMIYAPFTYFHAVNTTKYTASHYESFRHPETRPFIVPGKNNLAFSGDQIHDYSDMLSANISNPSWRVFVVDLPVGKRNLSHYPALYLRIYGHGNFIVQLIDSKRGNKRGADNESYGLSDVFQMENNGSAVIDLKAILKNQPDLDLHDVAKVVIITGKHAGLKLLNETDELYVQDLVFSTVSTPHYAKGEPLDQHAARMEKSGQNNETRIAEFEKFKESASSEAFLEEFNTLQTAPLSLRKTILEGLAKKLDSPSKQVRDQVYHVLSAELFNQAENTNARRYIFNVLKEHDLPVNEGVLEDYIADAPRLRHLLLIDAPYFDWKPKERRDYHEYTDWNGHAVTTRRYVINGIQFGVEGSIVNRYTIERLMDEDMLRDWAYWSRVTGRELKVDIDPLVVFAFGYSETQLGITINDNILEIHDQDTIKPEDITLRDQILKTYSRPGEDVRRATVAVDTLLFMSRQLNIFRALTGLKGMNGEEMADIFQRYNGLGRNPLLGYQDMYVNPIIGRRVVEDLKMFSKGPLRNLEQDVDKKMGYKGSLHNWQNIDTSAFFKVDRAMMNRGDNAMAADFVFREGATIVIFGRGAEKLDVSGLLNKYRVFQANGIERLRSILESRVTMVDSIITMTERDYKIIKKQIALGNLPQIPIFGEQGDEGKKGDSAMTIDRRRLLQLGLGAGAHALAPKILKAQAAADFPGSAQEAWEVFSDRDKVAKDIKTMSEADDQHLAEAGRLLTRYVVALGYILQGEHHILSEKDFEIWIERLKTNTKIIPYYKGGAYHYDGPGSSTIIGDTEIVVGQNGLTDLYLKMEPQRDPYNDFLVHRFVDLIGHEVAHVLDKGSDPMDELVAELGAFALLQDLGLQDAIRQEKLDVLYHGFGQSIKILKDNGIDYDDQHGKYDAHDAANHGLGYFMVSMERPDSNAFIDWSRMYNVASNLVYNQPKHSRLVKDPWKFLDLLQNQYGQVSPPRRPNDHQKYLASLEKGGIDFNSATLNLQIKRDGRGVPLPLAQQDMARLSTIQGFEPEIIAIKPAIDVPIISELQQKLQHLS